MSLDTKYRPNHFDGVIGQEATVRILTEFIKTGRGFQQSYLLAGKKGCGKTTLGRILARALLCESPVKGYPCDDCSSCLEMLQDPPGNECYTEMDAASNSGKDSIKAIVEAQQYDSFSGRKKIYLIDECFTEDTQLLTPDGPESIRDLVESKYSGTVLSKDVVTGEVSHQSITDWFDIPDEREVIQLGFDTSTVLIVTLNQEIYTPDRGWVKATNLKVGDFVECISDLEQVSGACKLMEIKLLGKQKVYDVTVYQNHCFFAFSSQLGNGSSPILVHNCHRLSRQAMDGLLKPMEDTVPGTEDKVLVCIMCTTEPDKMVDTISSRCAPTFQIKQVDPDTIAKRCEEVCKAEGVEYDLEALVLIAEVTGCHFRDALQSVSGVSMLGKITKESVCGYLNLGASSSYLRILSNLGVDQNVIVEEIEALKPQVSPSTCYAEMADAAVAIYKSKRFKVGNLPSYWDSSLLEPFVGSRLDGLLEVSSWLAKRPGRATYSMLSCDLLTLSQRLSRGVSLAAESIVVSVGAGQGHISQSAPEALTQNVPQSVVAGKIGDSAPENSPTVENGVFLDPRCFRKEREAKEASSSSNDVEILELELASRLLQGRLRELISGSHRQAR